MEIIYRLIHAQLARVRLFRFARSKMCMTVSSQPPRSFPLIDRSLNRMVSVRDRPAVTIITHLSASSNISVSLSLSRSLTPATVGCSNYHRSTYHAEREVLNAPNSPNQINSGPCVCSADKRGDLHLGCRKAEKGSLKTRQKTPHPATVGHLVIHKPQKTALSAP